MSRGRSVPAAPHGLTTRGAADLARAVARGDVSAEEVTLAHLHRIADVDDVVNALVRVDAAGALRAARRVDAARRAGHRLGPLAGVPVVVKDNLDVQGQATTCASRSCSGEPATRHAAVVSRMLAADAVLLGRANMDELALGASTATSAFGPTRNPWDPRRSPGGSSGGCAAAVAVGMAALAVGSDTGGSIREPASQCGVVGMAPSPGLVPPAGLVPFAPQFERVGPFARSCGDAALLLAVLSARPERAAAVDPRRGPVRVGVVAELAGQRNRPAVRARLDLALAALDGLGVEVVPVRLPAAPGALDAYFTLTSAACVRTLGTAVASGRAGDEVRRRYELGRTLRAADLERARIVRRALAAQARDALARCDVLVSPTMPTTAPLLNENPIGPAAARLTDPESAPYTDCWTVVANLAGLASLSVPCGFSAEDGMPVGIMLSAAAGADSDVLVLASALETAVAGDGRWAPPAGFEPATIRLEGGCSIR